MQKLKETFYGNQLVRRLSCALLAMLLVCVALAACKPQEESREGYPSGHWVGETAQVEFQGITYDPNIGIRFVSKQDLEKIGNFDEESNIYRIRGINEKVAVVIGPSGDIGIMDIGMLLYCNADAVDAKLSLFHIDSIAKMGVYGGKSWIAPSTEQQRVLDDLDFSMANAEILSIEPSKLTRVTILLKSSAYEDLIIYLDYIKTIDNKYYLTLDNNLSEDPTREEYRVYPTTDLFAHYFKSAS